MKIRKTAALGMWVVLLACSEKESLPAKMPEVQEPQRVAVPETIAEASGIADSRKNPGYLWVHEDSGRPASLYLLTHTGELAKTLHLKGVTNRDWEDIALAGERMYLADIGDNNQEYGTSTIYHFPEPELDTDTIQHISKLEFRYPDGPHDAEAIVVDAAAGEIYLITKRDMPARIYKIAAAQKKEQVQTAEYVGALPYSGVVSAALSAKGVIVKTYTGLYFYPRTGQQPISKVLQGNYSRLPYQLEPQGEAVTFAADGNGYYTLSEKLLPGPVDLHYYKL